eukprot:CAMPEP_0197579072 /NCGR_PEP_ID=MMETSP1326-20131121/3151_1 /TAXON_ID=1155430 /ORGANISM="Genus nov. species nov., Strain RCC2288" /LENGTH=156 /DNA_ID=CAMNT_0043142429 /DNA_START=145 /DNA_END=616 /DNA_ORIENTATION=-
MHLQRVSLLESLDVKDVDVRLDLSRASAHARVTLFRRHFHVHGGLRVVHERVRGVQGVDSLVALSRTAPNTLSVVAGGVLDDVVVLRLVLVHESLAIDEIPKRTEGVKRAFLRLCAAARVAQKTLVRPSLRLLEEDEHAFPFLFETTFHCTSGLFN